MFSKWFRFFSTLLDLSFILIFNTPEINAEERFRLASDVAKKFFETEAVADWRKTKWK